MESVVIALAGAAAGAALVVLGWRWREARGERATRARSAASIGTRECLECGATYPATDLFCKSCGAWPGQTG